LTIVLEWSRAEVGEGAYIAPMSHELNGIWALLVMPCEGQERDRGQKRARGRAGRQLREVEAVRLVRKQRDRQPEAQPAEQVHVEGLEGVADRLLGPV
jgi:hypothetical protein